MSSSDRSVDSIPSDVEELSAPGFDPLPENAPRQTLPGSRAQPPRRPSAPPQDLPEPDAASPSWEVPHAPTSASLQMLLEESRRQQPASPPTGGLEEHPPRSGRQEQLPPLEPRGDRADEPSVADAGGSKQPAPSREHMSISVPKVVGGALAAASAAVASSVLGVAGTVGGAVFASVVISVGTALYSRPIERTSQVLRETLPPRLERSRATVAGGASQSAGATSLRRMPRFGRSGGGSARSALSGRRWGAVALSAGAMLALAFVLLTGLEDVTGKPVSAWTGHGSDSGTTLGHLLGRGSPDSKHPPQQPPDHHRPHGIQQTAPNPPATTGPTAWTTAPATSPTATPTTTTATTPTTPTPTLSSTAPTRTVPTSPTVAHKVPPTTASP